MRRLAGFILGVCLAPLVLAEGKDNLWEITMRMEMPGMPAEMKGMMIPGMGSPQKQTVCLAEGKKYESEKQKECKVLDQSQSGRITRMTIQCKDGTMKMEREEISKVHWRAKMVMTGSRRGSEGEMTMFEEAKRIGSCNADQEGNMSRESQKLLGDAKVQADSSAAMMGQECEKAAADWPSSPQYFAGYDQQSKLRKDAIAKAKGNKDTLKITNSMYPDIPGCAKAKASYCAKSKAALTEMGSRNGYAAVMKRAKASSVSVALSYCGSDAAPITARHCKSAVSAADYAFVGDYCPDERNALAKEHCAGRAYTAVEPKYRAICTGSGNGDDGGRAYTAAKSGTIAGSVDSAQAAGAAAVEQGMKKLKGLFGF